MNCPLSGGTNVKAADFKNKRLAAFDPMGMKNKTAATVLKALRATDYYRHPNGRVLRAVAIKR